MQHWLTVRETLRPYIDALYQQAHLHGDPLMRPLFWHYPQDKQSWACEDQYLFGEDLLVAPVMQAVSVSAMSGCRRAIAGSLSTVSATPVGSISGCLRRWKPSRCLSAKEVHLSSSWWTDVRQVPKNRQFFQ